MRYYLTNNLKYNNLNITTIEKIFFREEITMWKDKRS